MSFWHQMLALPPAKGVTNPAKPAGNATPAELGGNEDSNFKFEGGGEIIKRAKTYANIYVGSTHINHQAQNPT